MTSQLEKEEYSVKEVAELFAVTPETVKLWLLGKQSHKMNGEKQDGRWVITADEIKRYANLLYGRSK